MKSPKNRKELPNKIIDPDELIHRTYLTDPDQDGQTFRAKIVQKIVDHSKDLQTHDEKYKFLASIDGDRADEIIGYNEGID